MKKTAVFIGILFFCFLGIANNSTPLFIRAISYEKDSIDGFLQIEFELVAFDSILVDSAYALDLPEDWTLLNPAEMNVIAMAADDTVRKTLLFQYATSALPFYPIQMTFVVLTSPETEDFVTTISCIYFTPYNTVEIWSFADFINLPRTWYFPNSSSPTRVYIYEDSIPVSNIPSEYEPTEDTLVLDTTDVNAPDSLSRWDNCGPGFRRYLGTITGQVLSPFLFVYKEGDTLLPLEGLKVQIWEDDGPIFSNMLGDSVTDANGYFTKTINTCQALEGNELEIKVRIVAENEEYDIKGKRQKTKLSEYP